MIASLAVIQHENAEIDEKLLIRLVYHVGIYLSREDLKPPWLVSPYQSW
jgi:hypothetical protein